MPLSTEVIVSIVFGIIASIVAIAAIVQAALYFARMPQGSNIPLRAAQSLPHSEVSVEFGWVRLEPVTTAVEDVEGAAWRVHTKLDAED